MKKPITIGLLLIPFLISTTSLVFAEDYYYFPDHKLLTPPEFCIIEFTDPKLPGAEDALYQLTINAIEEWENKLVRFTGEKQGWDFTYKVISQSQYDELFSEDVCDVTIYFEREPTTEEEITTAGHTFALWGLADITIFYLEPVWIYNGQTQRINGEIYEVADLSHFKNSLDPFNDETIKHEIGHALGLDHYPAKPSEIREQNGVYTAPSIMTLSEKDFLIDRMEITDYDIRSIVNLYGEDGINEFDGWQFLYFAFVLIVFLIIVYFARKKIGVQKPEYVPLDATDEGTKRCIRCSRLISSKGESEICNTCLQKDDFGE